VCEGVRHGVRPAVGVQVCAPPCIWGAPHTKPDVAEPAMRCAPETVIIPLEAMHIKELQPTLSDASHRGRAAIRPGEFYTGPLFCSNTVSRERVGQDCPNHQRTFTQTPSKQPRMSERRIAAPVTFKRRLRARGIAFATVPATIEPWQSAQDTTAVSVNVRIRTGSYGMNGSWDA
jgi:hypothetical protein